MHYYTTELFRDACRFSSERKCRPGRLHLTCLAHAAADRFAVASRFGNQLFASNKHRSSRRTQPFTEAQADAICTEPIKRRLECHCRVPQSGSIDVHSKPVLSCNRKGSLVILRRERDAASKVLCVLYADQLRSRMMHVIAPDRRLDIPQVHLAIVVDAQNAAVNPCDGGTPALLIDMDMSLVSQDHFGAASVAVAHDGA
eukprot:scaffold1913_cov257-Pinguiococcus_pyrenoidosus.AAC.32